MAGPPPLIRVDHYYQPVKASDRENMDKRKEYKLGRMDGKAINLSDKSGLWQVLWRYQATALLPKEEPWRPYPNTQGLTYDKADHKKSELEEY